MYAILAMGGPGAGTRHAVSEHCAELVFHSFRYLKVGGSMFERGPNGTRVHEEALFVPKAVLNELGEAAAFVEACSQGW